MTLRKKSARSRTSFVLEDGSVLSFDAMLSEAPSYSGKLTEHPVEGGGVVADHYTSDADTLSLELYMTNERQPFDTGPEVTTRDFDAFARLVALKNARQPLRVVTALDTYASMVIERVSTTRSSASGQSLKVNVELKRAVFATTATVEVPEALRSLRSQRAETEKQIGQADAQSVGDVARANEASSTASYSRGAEVSTNEAAKGAREPAQTPEQSATEKHQTSLLGSYF